MRVLEVRNVHEALPKAIRMLQQEGIQRDSRNGPVLQMPCPITTVYTHPCERVIFWPDRDANPFFHLYESLWMLAGRNDVAPLLKYAKRMIDFSDDGETLNGAYGYRWRKKFLGGDQLQIIAERLAHNPEDRRCVLQMWNAPSDLNNPSNDVPCNTIATFQRDKDGKLDLTVFCRSNDIVWGAYGANAVHFSMLLEYMALWIGCPVGRYYQVSVNFHAYLNTLKTVESLPNKIDKLGYCENPYVNKKVVSIEMSSDSKMIAAIDNFITVILGLADNEIMTPQLRPFYCVFPWANMVYVVLEAHQAYRHLTGEDKYLKPLEILNQAHCNNDWVVAAREWIQRRYEAWKDKQKLFNGELSHG